MSSTSRLAAKGGSAADKNPHTRAGLYLRAPGTALPGARQGRRHGGRAGQDYGVPGRATAGRVVDSLLGRGQSGPRRRGDRDVQQPANLGDEIC